MTRNFILILSAFLAAPLSAQVPGQDPNATSIVRTADLDLTRAADRQRLDRRLKHAIVDVCGDASPVDLAGQNGVAHCRSELASRLDPRRDQLIARSGRIRAVELAAGR
jgi:UrcA family protein